MEEIKKIKQIKKAVKELEQDLIEPSYEVVCEFTSILTSLSHLEFIIRKEVP